MKSYRLAILISCCAFFLTACQKAKLSTESSQDTKNQLLETEPELFVLNKNVLTGVQKYLGTLGSKSAGTIPKSFLKYDGIDKQDPRVAQKLDVFVYGFSEDIFLSGVNQKDFFYQVPVLGPSFEIDSINTAMTLILTELVSSEIMISQDSWNEIRRAVIFDCSSCQSMTASELIPVLLNNYRANLQREILKHNPTEAEFKSIDTLKPRFVWSKPFALGSAPYSFSPTEGDVAILSAAVFNPQRSNVPMYPTSWKQYKEVESNLIAQGEGRDFQIDLGYLNGNTKQILKIASTDSAEEIVLTFEVKDKKLLPYFRDAKLKCQMRANIRSECSLEPLIVNPDNDGVISFDILSGPPGMDRDVSKKVVYWRPASEDMGKVLTAVVSIFEEGESSISKLEVEIEVVGDSPPKFDVFPDTEILINEGEVSAPIKLVLSDSDPGDTKWLGIQCAVQGSGMNYNTPEYTTVTDNPLICAGPFTDTSLASKLVNGETQKEVHIQFTPSLLQVYGSLTATESIEIPIALNYQSSPDGKYIPMATPVIKVLKFKIKNIVDPSTIRVAGNERFVGNEGTDIEIDKSKLSIDFSGIDQVSSVTKWYLKPFSVSQDPECDIFEASRISTLSRNIDPLLIGAAADKLAELRDTGTKLLFRPDFKFSSNGSIVKDCDFEIVGEADTKVIHHGAISFRVHHTNRALALNLCQLYSAKDLTDSSIDTARTNACKAQLGTTDDGKAAAYKSVIFTRDINKPYEYDIASKTLEFKQIEEIDTEIPLKQLFFDFDVEDDPVFESFVSPSTSGDILGDKFNVQIVPQSQMLKISALAGAKSQVSSMYGRNYYNVSLTVSDQVGFVSQTLNLKINVDRTLSKPNIQIYKNLADIWPTGQVIEIDENQRHNFKIDIAPFSNSAADLYEYQIKAPEVSPSPASSQFIANFSSMNNTLEYDNGIPAPIIKSHNFQFKPGYEDGDSVVSGQAYRDYTVKFKISPQDSVFDTLGIPITVRELFMSEYSFPIRIRNVNRLSDFDGQAPFTTKVTDNRWEQVINQTSTTIHTISLKKGVVRGSMRSNYIPIEIQNNDPDISDTVSFFINNNVNPVIRTDKKYTFNSWTPSSRCNSDSYFSLTPIAGWKNSLELNLKANDDKSSTQFPLKVRLQILSDTGTQIMYFDPRYCFQ